MRLMIEIDSDPISGSVSNGTGHSRAFNGWIELAAVIEAARSADPAATDGLGEVQVERLGSLPGAKASGL
ncbi:MAG TPA: hypothetical protein VMA76_02765 [Solirubrobacteraceae bacterium]|nr:hypothetical protein [Solirubrobacteraceae bacterium]